MTLEGFAHETTTMPATSRKLDPWPSGGSPRPFDWCKSLAKSMTGALSTEVRRREAELSKIGLKCLYVYLYLYLYPSLYL